MWDVVIVGCGPVGATAANLSGRAGRSTLVIERDPQIFDLPRAIHFDAHIMRILQQIGLAERMVPNTRTWRRSTFYGADSQPIRVHDWPTDNPYGWDAHYLFYQPTLEQILREGLGQYENVEVRLGVEVVGIAQHDDQVVVTTRDAATGKRTEVAARYLIGTDGASSFVRSNSGIQLVDGDFDEPWLVVDLRCERELGRPNESEMFCDPVRPSTRVPGPGNHHRWEFMLLPGESVDDVSRSASIEALLKPWVSADEVEIIRASVYRFHSLIAQRWRDARVFLAGDAAHQTPPFLGQGLCHGIRDVQNLIMKLSAVFAGGPSDVLLDSYEAERRPHVQLIVDMAVAAGREICLLDPHAAAERDRRTRAAAVSGELPRTTFQGMPPLSGGLFTTTDGAGELFGQPRLRGVDGRPTWFDDLVGPDIAVVALPGVAAALRADHVPVVEVRDSAAEWFTAHRARAAVLRPDRYVYGTAPDAEETQRLLRELRALFPVRRP
jgi:3-(3-hydroxy-phenyl)propionate hydroxylase